MMTLRQRCLTESINFARSHLLDDFYKTHDVSLVSDSILDLQNLTISEKSLLAATVDEICSMNNIDPPNWVFDPSTYLDEPVFAMNARGPLRIILLQESPCWYRSRNLFVSKNCSERV